MKKRKVPKWVLKNMGLKTQRQYKELKRKQIKAVEKAIKEYWSGSAFCPMPYFEVCRLRTMLDGLRKAHSIKEWGR